MNKLFKAFSNYLNEQETVFVFGDSHTEVFEFINTNYPYSNFSFDVTKVGGATAQGLVNPNSKTNCLEIFDQKIASINNKKSKIIFLLGEVDTGFVVWYRALKYNESVEFQLNRSITNYFLFLDNVKARGYNNLYLLSAPLPTIKDNQPWGDVANLRREVKATQKERTNLTLEYNSRLRQLCEERGFGFIDLDHDLLDKGAGIINEKFLNDDKNNHHLNTALYAAICLSSVSNLFRAGKFNFYRLLKYHYQRVKSRVQRVLKNLKRIIIRLSFNSLLKIFNFNRTAIYCDQSISPVWVVGMFRSGTSLTCDVLQTLGADFGPEDHLLQARGKLRELNPNGFFENFLFAEFSRYIFKYLNAEGDRPPASESVNSVRLDQLEKTDIVRYSFFHVNEDRISKSNKLKVYVSFLALGLNGYLKKHFSTKPFIKIPHLTFLAPLLLKIWPNSKFILVFRNPDSVIKSSKILTEKVNYDLYLEYNKQLFNDRIDINKMIILSYDNLIDNPHNSIINLYNALNLNSSSNKVREAVDRIDPKLLRNKVVSEKPNWPNELNSFYEILMANAVNKN